MSVSFGSLHHWPAALAAAAVLLVGGCGSGDGDTQTTAPAVTAATAEVAEEQDGAAGEVVAPPEDEPAERPADDRQAISDSLETVLTSSDPREVCMEFVTDRYVRRSFGDAAGCQRAQADIRRADSARVSRIVVLPDSVAQASVVADGGLYGGERLRAQMVLDSGVWKVDSLRANVPVGP